MESGTAPRYIMRQAMIQFCDAAEQKMVDLFLQNEAMSRSDDSFVSSAGRVAWSSVVAKALAGKLVITGHLDGGAEVVIPAGFLANSRPDFHKQMLLTDAGLFSGVLVSRNEAVPVQESAKPLDAGATATKGRGGRTPAHDWTRVAAEVVRIAHMEDLGNRRFLVARMIEWCAANLDTHPDPSSVRKYVLSLCPADLPAE